jgi:hypothetical protein
MKKLQSIASVTVLSFIVASSARATIPVGRGEVSLSASASVAYDSNVEGRRGAGEDYYGTFSPRVSYTRRAGRIEADASASVTSTRYRDRTEYDSDNPTAEVSLKLSEASFQKVSASMRAAYAKTFDINPDLNGRVKAETVTIAGSAGLDTGARTSINLNGSYSNFQHDTIGASDQRMLNGGGAFNYRGFLDGTTLILSYDYTQTKTSGDNLIGVDLDQSSHLTSLGLSRALYRDVTGRISYGYRILNRSAAETSAGETRSTGTVLSASVEGPFLPRRVFPKIESSFSIAYSDATTPGINDPGSKQLTGDVSLSWAARERTTVTLGLSRSQRLAVSDVGVVTTTARASIQQQLRHNLSGSVGASYDWNKYQAMARSDESFSWDANLNYDFAESWNATAAYTYTTNKSDQTISAYRRHLAILSLGYTF